MGKCPEGMTLDRKDNSLGYYKENCRWATPTQQNNNKKGVRLIKFAGLTMNVTEWAVFLKISPCYLQNFRSRISTGYGLVYSACTPLQIAGSKKLKFSSKK